MKMQSRTLQLAIGVTCGVLSLASFAEDFGKVDDPWSVSLSGGRYFLENDHGEERLGLSERETDTHRAVGGSVRYGFNSRFSAEATYRYLDFDGNVGYRDIDADQYHLDGIMHFGPRSQDGRRPFFLSAGAGQFLGDDDLELDDQVQLNLGVGFDYALYKDVGVRAEVRRFHGLDTHDNDTYAGVGFTYKFGGASSPSDRSVTVITPPVEMDSDGDGVMDSKDRCANTPAGARVDVYGCALKLEKELYVKVQTAFENDSSEITSFSEINKIVDAMRQYPGTKVLLQGHTDSVGSAAYNRKLSRERAASVASLLINSFNIAPDRIQVEAYGEDRPVADNRTASGRAANRRVDVTISEKVKI